MDNESIKFSIIVPVYNVEEYLERCVDSVLKQSYSNYEIVMVDDGSSDDSSKICDNYSISDNRIKVIHKKNGGLSDARNSGVAICDGDYVLFLDSDDYWNSSDALGSLAKRLECTKTDVLSFPYIKYDDDTQVSSVALGNNLEMPTNNITKEEQLKYLTTNSLYIASACNKAIRTSIVKNSKFEIGRFSEDILWCAKLLLLADSFDYIDFPFYVYTQRSKSISHSISIKNCNDLCHAVLECEKILQECEKSIYDSLARYTSYQFSTFIAVQSFSDIVPGTDIRKLSEIKYVLKFGISKRVKLMNIGVSVFGLKLWCKIIRMTRPVWDAWRKRR